MDGILIVDKPQGMTSHDVVDFVRKRFGFKKVGHAGTLDPMATGVLVILIGKYTKSSGQVMSRDKEYDATMVLGATSDTLDAWGRLTPRGKPARFTNEEIGTAFKRFLGDIEQFPPMYSAVKFKGRKLYELARRGISVTPSPRKVSIKKLEISKIALPEISFRLTCSKGTYVRQLSADIGESLGCGAYLSRLRRLASGDFTIDRAMGFEKLKGLEKSELEKRLVFL